jgi:hypothetical protein
MAEFLTSNGTIAFGLVRTQTEKFGSIVVDLNGAVSGPGTVTLHDTFAGQVNPGHIWVAKVDNSGNPIAGTIANANSIAVGSSITHVRFWVPWKPTVAGQDISTLAGAFQITSDTAANGDFTLDLTGIAVDSGADPLCGADNDIANCAPGTVCKNHVCTAPSVPTLGGARSGLLAMLLFAAGVALVRWRKAFPLTRG